MKFNCDKCGACCRQLYLFGLPYEWLLDPATGACKYFDMKTNCCTVYPIRPTICNIELGYHLYFSHLAQDEFYRKNEEACIILKNMLKDE